MTDIEHNPQVLGDSPTADDKLGFAEPAARLADKIASFPSDTPMVVGVEGKWGEGKSSFLLMMEKHWRGQGRLVPKDFRTKFGQFIQEKILRKKSARKIKLIKFDPWWFSGKENLLDKLLKELEGQEPWWRMKLRALLSSLEKQVNVENKWVNSGVNVVALALASGASAILNPIFDLFGSDALSSMKSWLQDGRATAALVLALFFVIQFLLKQFIAWLSPPEGFDARKEKLKELLEKDRFRRVVFVDDLDRLPADELQEMFRVIKSVTNFPNVIYVLAYDFDIVSTALDKFYIGQGGKFLEKIINISLPLPTPETDIKTSFYQEIFSNIPEMESFFKKINEGNHNLKQAWNLICLNFIRHTRHTKRLAGIFLMSFNSNIGMSEIYFLFLEALRLNNKAMHVKACLALVSDGFLECMETPKANDSTNNKDNDGKKNLEWLVKTGFDADIAEEEKQYLRFFIGIRFTGETCNSGIWSIFASNPQHGTLNLREKHSHIRMAMIGYMRSSQNDELKNLLRQGAQILSAKSISELFVKNANLQHIQKALRAQFIMQSSSEIDSLTLAFRKILMIMAEAFEYTYRKSIYKDLTDEDLALIGFTDEMTNFILKLFSKSTSKLIPEPSNHDDNEYIQAYPLFYGKNRLSFNCISAILASYPPDFFIRHAVENKNSYQNWIFSLVQWMLDCRDICEGHALREWVEQLPDIKEGPEGKKLIALYGNIALGFCYFLSNNGYLPEILGHEKIFHLTEKIKSEFRGNSYYEKIIEEFENSHKK